VKALPAELLASRPQVPWREIAKLRDLLARPSSLALLRRQGKRPV
jgi:uncharacterized protein with HEPN domain